jgi:hypothetical protein
MARCAATWHIREMERVVAEGAMMFYGRAVGDVFGHDVSTGARLWWWMTLTAADGIGMRACSAYLGNSPSTLWLFSSIPFPC